MRRNRSRRPRLPRRLCAFPSQCSSGTLSPLSETRVRVGRTSLMMEFVVDEAGVTLVLGSGFQQMLARLTSKR